MALEYGYFDSEITDYDDEGMPVFDRAKTSDFMALFYSKLISSGVLADPDNCFYVKSSGGMTVEVQPGYAFVRGRFAYLEEAETLELEPANSGNSRIDLVVLRNNYPMRMCELIIKTGTPAANPVAPDLIQAESGVDYYELCLAKIEVKKSATSITQSNITDTRFDSNYCGPVTQLIDHIDTSIFFEQLNAFYEEFVKQTETDYSDFLSQMAEYLEKLEENGNSRLQVILDELISFEGEAEESFNEWFEKLKSMLEGDVAANLAEEILELQERCDKLEEQRDEVYEMFVSGYGNAGIVCNDGTGIVTHGGYGLVLHFKLCQCGCKC